MRNKEQKQKLLRLDEEKEDEINEDQTTTNDESSGNFGEKKGGKKGKSKKQAIIKPKLIDEIDKELNQVEFCNYADDSTPPSKIDFASKHHSYFETYLIENLLPSTFNSNTNTLNLSNISLNNDCTKTVNKTMVTNNISEYDNEYLDKLTEIELNNNKFIKIPLNLINLLNYSCIETIKLNNNSISQDIDLDDKCYTNLKTFDISSNMVSSVKIRNDLKIERLNLENNKIENFEFLAKLKHLKYLNLSSNKMQITPIEFKYLHYLIELNLSNNKSLNLCTPSSAAFSNLKHLKILNLSGNQLNNLPNDIKDLSRLEELYLDNNNLEFIPTQIYELKSLRILSMNENKLSEISKLFCLNSKFRSTLNVLKLKSNQLTTESFSAYLYLFKSLKKLDLSSNKFKLIPSTLPESLEELKLNFNRLESLLIRTVNKQRMFALEMAEDDDQIDSKQTFDDYDDAVNDDYQHKSVFYLRNLQRLYLHSNYINEIPTDFAILNTTLEYLDLSKNQLKGFDSSLCRGFVYLKYLNLSFNSIRFVPEQIRELQKLRYLYLNNNQINRLNYELCNDLTNLVELDLSSNQIDDLPIFLHKQGTLHTFTRNTPSLNRNLFNDQHTFTFGLKSLKQINLSSNRLISVFSFHTAFGLSANLQHINLSNNLITDIEVDKDYEQGDNEEKTQYIRLLRNVEYINLSNNQIEFTKGGFTKLLINLYKIMPNLKQFIYDQLNGVKIINTPTIQDNNFYFEISNQITDEINDDNNNNNNNNNNANQLLESNEYDLLINKLEILDLSNNDLSVIPSLLYKLRQIKQIYLNGNNIQKIPRDLVHVTSIPKSISSNNNNNQQQKQVVDDKTDPTQTKSIGDNIEIIQLNDNKLEQIPENFFMHFKNLKEIQIFNNPLKEPPKEAVCAATSTVNSSNAFDSNLLDDDNLKDIWNNELNDEQGIELASIITESTIDSFNDHIKPIISYMNKYKRREEMLLCNMFVLIKDEIDSIETLLKLMRRLKMPMDKVELVCNEIEEYVKANWHKFAADKQQLRLKKRELTKAIKKFALKIQTWKLLNIWRHIYGTDASSDELIRILKLMNSNEFEDSLYTQVQSLKYIASTFKI